MITIPEKRKEIAILVIIPKEASNIVPSKSVTTFLCMSQSACSQPCVLVGALTAGASSVFRLRKGRKSLPYKAIIYNASQGYIPNTHYWIFIFLNSNHTT